MNCIRKTAAGTAAILLSLTMAACHQTAPSSVTTVATMPESSKSTLAAVQVQGGEELDKLLDQVEDNVFPGTAGCSLTAVRYTVSLLDWCKTAGVSDTELRADLTAWVQGKDTVELARKFELVMDVYDRLMGDSAQDLLDTAGVQTLRGSSFHRKSSSQAARTNTSSKKSPRITRAVMAATGHTVPVAWITASENRLTWVGNTA